MKTAQKLNRDIFTHFLPVNRMPIEFRPLVDDTYYRDVKGIFSTAFANNYDRSTIISAWKNRGKDTSFAFYDTDLNTVIGFAMMHRTTDTMLYLSYMGMAEDIRGNGIGTKMMKRLLKYAAKLGCSMTAIPFSGVIPWYEGLGFSRTCDKFNFSFHQHGTRKQAKFIEALDSEHKPYKTYTYMLDTYKVDRTYNIGWSTIPKSDLKVETKNNDWFNFNNYFDTLDSIKQYISS